MVKLNIRFSQTDPDAKRDSSPSATDKQPWIDITELKLDDVAPPNVMTLEPGQALLDGTMDEFPSNPTAYDWGLITLSQSNSQGIFDGAALPTVDTVFGSVHKGLGLTIFNYPWTQDWVASVRVTWYATNLTTVIKSGVYALTGVVGVIPEPIDGYRRIKTELLTTNIPYRFAKIFNIEYGIVRTFENGDIDTANLLEEIDPISDILSINTFGFSIRTHNAEFSPISGDIADDMFIKRQSMSLTADNKPFGTFFLDTWKDRHNDGTVFDFQAMDAIGAMDGYKFMGDIYVNVLASGIIAQLFALCFPTQIIKYQLDDDFAATRITGHIPICTARQALQYICFAIGAVADTSRRNYVWIYRRDTEMTFDVTRRYLGGDNGPTQYFSGLDLTAYEYRVVTEAQEIHSGVLAVGQHPPFEFSEPLHTLTISGAATITAKSANYATINVTTAGTVVLKGNRYQRNERVHSISTEDAAGQQGNICEFSGATLVDNAKAPVLAADLWKYISQRTLLNREVRLDDLEVGYVAKVATRQRPIVGTIERLDTNMRGGRAKMKVVGDVVVD